MRFTSAHTASYLFRVRAINNLSARGLFVFNTNSPLLFKATSRWKRVAMQNPRTRFILILGLVLVLAMIAILPSLSAYDEPHISQASISAHGQG